MFGGLQADPAVRRPIAAIEFGSFGPDDWQKSILSVAVDTGLAPNVDVARVVIALQDTFPTAEIGDSGSISLGYEDSSTDTVFTGRIESVTYTIRGTCCLTAVNGGAKLSKLRVNQSYEQQKAGDIAGDLTGRAGVKTDAIEDGLTFPYFVMDDRRNAYQHIAALAGHSGYLAFFGVADLLSFAPFVSGQPVHTFTYGKDIISLTLSKTAPVVGTLRIIGEGAAGSEGDEAWSWLIKDPESVTGSAGEGEPERTVPIPALRSSDAAQHAADGMASISSLMQVVGELLVPGSPMVSVGSAVEIANAPSGELNGLCLVRELRHYFHKYEGFLTRISFSKVDGTGTGGLL